MVCKAANKLTRSLGLDCWNDKLLRQNTLNGTKKEEEKLNGIN